MRQVGWLRAWLPVPVLAALGVVLGGCACCGPRHHGDAERAVQWPSYTPTSSIQLERELARGGRGR